MKASTIGILMGGKSVEHEVSLMSGAAMLAALRERGLRNIRAVTVSHTNEWSSDGRPSSLYDALRGLDVALLAFHGEWGEDGRAQALMEWFGLPYNGSRPAASALAMDKPASRVMFREHGLRVPQGAAYVRPSGSGGMARLVDAVVHAHPIPVVVKPAGRGSSVGVSIVRNPNHLHPALSEALKYDNRILVEEFISGTEVSCGVLEDVSGALRVFPVVQIIPPPKHEFFDFTAKYSGESQEIVPAPIPDRIGERIREAALTAHRALGCRHYSRTDMIIKDGEPIVLEVNTLPGMTPQSILPKAAAVAGMSYSDLIERFLLLALRDKD